MSGFLREVDENCVSLCCNAESSVNSLPTFRDVLSVPCSHVQGSRIQKEFLTFEEGFLNAEDVTDRLSRNVGNNDHYSLLNNPEEHSSYEYLLFLQNSLPFLRQCGKIL